MAKTYVNTNDFQREMRRAAALQDAKVLQAMQMWQVMVINEAKSNHTWRKSLSPAEAERHSDPKFYQVTGKAVNSMRPGEVELMSPLVAWAEVLAGGPETDYVAGLELGTATSRAFPFMGPAMTMTSGRALLMLAAMLNKVFTSR